LVFALKRDGVDLLALDRIFQKLDPTELAAELRKSPTSKYLRRLWMFYERLTGNRLEIDDLKTGNYVDALEPELYVVRDNGPNLRRYRVRWNLLGVPGWCPVVRWTDELRRWHAAELHVAARESVAQVPVDVLARAVRWLIARDTKASFEIERARPTARAQKFVDTLLTGPHRQDYFWREEQFVEVQANLLDGRFTDEGWRQGDVCISDLANLSGAAEVVHHVGAKADDLRTLMGSFGDAWTRHHLVQLDRPLPGAVALGDEAYAFRASSPDRFLDLAMAACLSFGFVFIHPFSDGNGRIHRLLLSHVLRMTRHSPDEVPLPIAASIAADPRGYDDALEDFSKRTLPYIDYDFDSKNELRVLSETCHLYQYPDLTKQTEAICGWYDQSVREGIAGEVDTLRRFDAAVEGMRSVVDMPDRLERLFLQICYHNGKRGLGYRLGKRKREHQFSKLNDDEIRRLEEAVADAFESLRGGPASEA